MSSTTAQLVAAWCEEAAQRSKAAFAQRTSEIIQDMAKNPEWARSLRESTAFNALRAPTLQTLAVGDFTWAALNGQPFELPGSRFWAADGQANLQCLPICAPGGSMLLFGLYKEVSAMMQLLLKLKYEPPKLAHHSDYGRPPLPAVVLRTP